MRDAPGAGAESLARGRGQSRGGDARAAPQDDGGSLNGLIGAHRSIKMCLDVLFCTALHYDTPRRTVRAFQRVLVRMCGRIMWWCSEIGLCRIMWCRAAKRSVRWCSAVATHCSTVSYSVVA